MVWIGLAFVSSQKTGQRRPVNDLWWKGSEITKLPFVCYYWWQCVCIFFFFIFQFSLFSSTLTTQKLLLGNFCSIVEKLSDKRVLVCTLLKLPFPLQWESMGYWWVFLRAFNKMREFFLSNSYKKCYEIIGIVHIIVYFIFIFK